MHVKKMANFVLFVAGWWLALLGGNAMALIALFVVLMLHFFMWRDIRDIFLVLGFIFCGFAVEWAFMLVGIHEYQSSLPPAWAICIWAMLATTVRYSLAWLIHKPLYAALAGLFIAPVFYLNSVYFGSASWGRPLWQCLIGIALVWSLLAALISGVLAPRVNQIDAVENRVG
uniref:DUF2878 domain-containing protein n=1 Tax=Microbulbifer agarilyticus TaxID=260552 RepID=UPI000255B991|nr:DUF2878 domain-containing protein [Microbulbifer agarilyticus]